MAENKIPPILNQYFELKKKAGNAILFFRLGDFYEMFYDDAKVAAEILEIALTKKSFGLKEGENAPLAGIPIHSKESYLAKLLKAGYSVAIAEQMEDASEAKGMIKREITEIISPGTTTLETCLEKTENNFLLYIGDENLEYIDVSTGEFFSEKITPNILSQINKINPSEIIISKNHKYAHLIDTTKATLTEDNLFEYLENMKSDVFTYLKEKQEIRSEAFMKLPENSITSLELLTSISNNDKKNSLAGILDKTKTAMGSRFLKKQVVSPLLDIHKIIERQKKINYFLEHPIERNNIRQSLKSVYDIERLTGRFASKKANPRDFLALKRTLYNIPNIKMELEGELFSEMLGALGNYDEITDEIETAILDDAPILISDGGIIKKGYSEELDELKELSENANKILLEFETKERERLNIPKLKISFNRVFGYFIELTNAQMKSINIPDDYIRKQTLSSCERFINPELKSIEDKIISAKARLSKLELELFKNLRDKISLLTTKMQRTGEVLSEIDFYQSLAEVSEENDYTFPKFKSENLIKIIKGRHPIIEKISNEIFVKNDCYIKDKELILITGPNMGGKSTFMRQIALIQIMAQIGCPVPCEEASLGICTGIFTRIGSSDNLSGGESTFFVEMKELSSILKNASERDLVILDEIGRGTSTIDGISIAYASAEFLRNRTRTLFATHYHELTDYFKNSKNLFTDILIEGGELTLLHKIMPGVLKDSYGLDIAKLAGIDDSVIKLAENKLSEIEKTKPKNNNNGQMSFF